MQPRGRREGFAPRRRKVTEEAATYWPGPLRALIVLAHPSPYSYCAAAAKEAADALVRAGHLVEICDLYAEKFDPVMPREGLAHYLDAPANRRGVEREVAALFGVEALIFAFPVWHDGLPAILKGYFDRVFVRGVAFEIVDGVFYPNLGHVRRLGAIALYGASRARTALVGDLPRRFFKHNLKALTAPDSRFDYLAAYDLDVADGRARARYLARVRRAFAKW